MSSQLYTECKRIEGVQETVNACVKQSKELQAIHHKLEESHQMWTQMLVTRAWREDQDTRILKQDQQRTVLLVDVM